MSLLLGALAAGGVAATGAGIGGAVEKRRQKKLDETAAGRARQAELGAAQRRRETGQYGFTEAERRQRLKDVASAGQAARREALANQQTMVGTQGQGRSGTQTRMASEIERGTQMAAAQAAETINQASQAKAEQQKQLDVALESSELDRQAMLAARRQAARRRGALLGLNLGAKAADLAVTGGAARAAAAEEAG